MQLKSLISQHKFLSMRHFDNNFLYLSHFVINYTRETFDDNICWCDGLIAKTGKSAVNLINLSLTTNSGG